MGSRILGKFRIGEKKWQNNNKKTLKSVDFNAFLDCGGRIVEIYEPRCGSYLRPSGYEHAKRGEKKSIKSGKIGNLRSLVTTRRRRQNKRDDAQR